MINIAERNLGAFGYYSGGYRAFRVQLPPRNYGGFANCPPVTLDSFASFGQSDGLSDLPDNALLDTNTGNILDAQGNLIAVDNNDGTASGVTQDGTVTGVNYTMTSLQAIGSTPTAAQAAVIGNTANMAPTDVATATGNSIIDQISGLLGTLGSTAVKAALAPGSPALTAAQKAAGVKAAAPASSSSNALMIALLGGAALLVIVLATKK